MSVSNVSALTASLQRWKKTASGGETSLSSADDVGNLLTYTPGYEQLYLNGVLLVRGADYVATTGSTITGLTALTAGDVVEVLALSAFSVADAISIAGSAVLSNKTLVTPQETWTVSATAATGTINYDCGTQGVLYYTTNASNNFTLNFRWNSTTTLGSVLPTNTSALTVSFLVTNGITAYYPTAFQVDGTATGVTVKWSAGTAPSAGNASAVDAYSFTIIETGSGTYTILAAGPIKYA